MSESPVIYPTLSLLLRKKESPNEELVFLGGKLFSDPLDGYAFPVHLRDTYGLLVNLSVDEIRASQTGTYQPDYSPQPTENVMRTLEAVINLQQTESDRQLNTTIQVFGTGLTTASITAAILSTQVQKPTYELPWWSALSLSLFVGCCLGLVMYLITQRNSQ